MFNNEPSSAIEQQHHLHHHPAHQNQQHHQGSWCSPAHFNSHFFQQPSSSFHPGSFTSPSSFGASSLARMESTFCKNFVCCSIPLDDLHDLLEHYEQAHCHQGPAQSSTTATNDSSHASASRPDLVVFEDEDEWSGTESGSTNPSSRTDGFDRSHSPADNNHHWSATAPSHSREQSTTTTSSRRKSPTNHWSKIEDGFGIPPSLLDGQSLSSSSSSSQQPGQNSSSIDPTQQLLMMIDTDQDGSSSTGSDRNLETRSRSGQGVKRRLGPDQSDWETSGREKPFKCTVPGCEKAYKQPNGLKYHKAHGHCSQKSLSAEDESKTFVCHDAVCGKRYKNINGLRYHYQHTGPHGAIGLQLLSLAP
ncbi:hypothetical protein PCANC_01396 [Puccinia coronata f. sp. avenae]|uniref:C2H2-type domain-containing protein n=1 Tax=Puccinia coronata f. sp. avenae TaxID=200324 RepID=A0A2N5W611_9BASI|nr:hypothetical protein PCANC_01396 [Puccinia coronata f. sp. avenae]